MADLLSIGRTGLMASQTQLSVTGHNISNADTEGYSRQSAIQSAQAVQFATGIGYLGSGTTIVDVRRAYDAFLTSQVRTTTSLNSEAVAYQGQIEPLDSLLSDSTTSLSTSMQTFFSSLQTAASDPANPTSRQLILTDAQSVAQRFNSLYSTLSDQQSLLSKQMGSTVDQINQLASTIAKLNGSISGASAQGSQPNDLLDARDEAIRKLSSYAGVTVSQQDATTFNISIGNSGYPLVVGEKANSLSVTASADDPTQASVNFVFGDQVQDITSQISGGQLAGLIRYQNEALTPTMNSLGQMALVFSDAINTQLGQGLDLSSNAGVALFSDINTTQLMSQRVVASADNESGVGGQLKVSDAGNLTGSDYTLTYNGTSYSAQRLSDGATMTVTQDAAGVFTFTDAQGLDQGISLTLSGTPATGDSFQLQPTRTGAGAISVVLAKANQLALAAPLKSESNTQNAGSGTLGQPTLTSITDNATPPQAAALSTTDLQGISPITWTYDSTSGALSPTLPSSVPAGWAVTVTPSSLAVTSGQTNTLSYTLQVNNGTTTTNYGVQQSFTGTPQNGDTFTLAFNSGGVSDNRNALALVGLQNQEIVGKNGSSSATLSDSYNSVVERIGTLTSVAQQDSSTTGALLTQATDSRESVSGVNLDEEAANMIKFQQQYNASAQVIQVARSLFDTLLTALQ